MSDVYTKFCKMFFSEKEKQSIFIGEILTPYPEMTISMKGIVLYKDDFMIDSRLLLDTIRSSEEIELETEDAELNLPTKETTEDPAEVIITEHEQPVPTPENPNPDPIPPTIEEKYKHKHSIEFDKKDGKHKHKIKIKADEGLKVGDLVVILRLESKFYVVSKVVYI